MVDKLKYIFFSLCRNKISFLLLVIQFASSFILINMAIDINKYLVNEIQKIDSLFTDDYIYGLIDDREIGAALNFSNDELNSLYTDISNLSNAKFVSFYPTRTKIHGSSLITNDSENYHNNNQILVNGKISDANYIDVVKFDESLLDFMDFNLLKGSFFEKGRMYIDDYIPVVLGSTFNNHHNIGDILYAENTMSYDYELNMNNSIKLKVIGILSPQTEIPLISIRDSGSFKNIDDFIMIPYFTDEVFGLTENNNELNIDTIDNISSGALLIDQNSNIKNTLQNLNESQSFMNFDVLDIKERFDSSINILKMKENAYRSLSIAIIFFSTIGIVMVFLNIIKKSLKEFSIHLLSGANIKDISQIILGQILFIVIFSLFITFLSLNTISKYSSNVIYSFDYIINLGIGLFIILISWLIPKRYIQHLGIIKILKGES